MGFKKVGSPEKIKGVVEKKGDKKKKKANKETKIKVYEV